MKNDKFSGVLNKSLLLAVTFIFNVLVFAQSATPTAPPTPPGGGGVGAVGPGELERTPIDMYQSLLLVIAVMFIVGMYYYNKRRKLA